MYRLSFACTKCGKSLKATVTKAVAPTTTVECPRCSNRFVPNDVVVTPLWAAASENAVDQAVEKSPLSRAASWLHLNFNIVRQFAGIRIAAIITIVMIVAATSAFFRLQGESANGLARERAVVDAGNAEAPVASTPESAVPAHESLPVAGTAPKVAPSSVALPEKPVPASSPPDDAVDATTRVAIPPAQPLRANALADVLKSVCHVETPDASGTGFVVSNRSLVATNYHVIAGANKATVSFPDGSVIPVRGFRIASPKHDLAILELKKDAPSKPLRLQGGGSEIGIDVYAIGTPRGLTGSVTKGVVSGRRPWIELQPILTDDADEFTFDPQSRWVQTDAAITPGNSGGPLCLVDGTVIAVNTLSSKADFAQNINFAVDALHLTAFLDRLPDRAKPLSSLPFEPKKQAAPADHLRKTKEYWASMAAVLGTYLTNRKIAFTAATDPKPSPTSFLETVRGRKVEPWKTDVRFGGTEPDRNTKMRRMAREAGIGTLYGRLLTYDELTELAKQQKTKRKEDAKQVQQQIQMYELMRTPMGREAMMMMLSAKASARVKAEGASVAAMFNAHAQHADMAAARLERLPIDGVLPPVIDFVTDLATAQRAFAAESRKVANTIPALTTAGSEVAREAAERQHHEALNAFCAAKDSLDKVLYVAGKDLQMRARNLLGEDLGPIVTYTAEQEKVFANEAAKP